MCNAFSVKIKGTSKTTLNDFAVKKVDGGDLYLTTKDTCLKNNFNANIDNGIQSVMT